MVIKGLRLKSIQTTAKQLYTAGKLSSAHWPSYTMYSSRMGMHNLANSSKLPYQIKTLKNVYRRFGHLYATNNPLVIKNGTHSTLKILESTGIPIQDYKNEISQLEGIYCKSIGYEFDHLSSEEEKAWLVSMIEGSSVPTDRISNKEKIEFLEKLISAEEFENYLNLKFPGQKRFGSDGCETIVPLLDKLITTLVTNNNRYICIGMAHRGRLNVLKHILGKPLDHILYEFTGKFPNGLTKSLIPDPEWYKTKNIDNYSGDQKYHLGWHARREIDEKLIDIELLPNPSHLEAITPVVMGVVRANSSKNSVGIIIHGDAAIAGQGVVYESMAINNLPSYKNRGNVHIVINNQIGFTTDPEFGRSTQYCTDIAKVYDIPIFHVDATDPLSIIKVVNLAVEWQQKYNRDVFIDLIGWRKNGHNEFDDPSITQPLLYNSISKMKPISSKFSKKLIADNILTEKELEDMQNICKHNMDISSKSMHNFTYLPSSWNVKIDQGIASIGEQYNNKISPYETGIKPQQVINVLKVLTELPDGFTPHKIVKRILNMRKQMRDEKLPIDMGAAEALAIGTLLEEGHGIRFTGQDVERGTFGHRHMFLIDQKNGSKWNVFTNLSKIPSDLQLSNSPLSEYAVLGFEYGFSIVAPEKLVLWEAQFGDFSNTAQVILDQFIMSARSKWNQQSGLVLLLPHGYDGAGSEHSSGRIDRFLGQSSDYIPDSTDIAISELSQIQEKYNNYYVTMPTTPANYFHILRRQVKSSKRVPCIIFTSKALLRHPAARSVIKDFTEDVGLKKVIPDKRSSSIGPVSSPSHTHLFCSGQIYYKLETERQKSNLDSVFIHRIEQLSPFPYEEIHKLLTTFPADSIKEIKWVQEEPLNFGMWQFISPRLTTLMKHLSPKIPKLGVVSRPLSGAVATGYSKVHSMEEKKVLMNALDLPC